MATADLTTSELIAALLRVEEREQDAYRRGDHDRAMFWCDRYDAIWTELDRRGAINSEGLVIR